MLSNFAQICEEKFNYIIDSHKKGQVIRNINLAKFYSNRLIFKLENILRDLKESMKENSTFNKFPYLTKEDKVIKISEIKAHLLLISLVKFIHINDCNLNYMNELREIIYSYGLNVDLESTDALSAFTAPKKDDIPFNINKEKILKFVRLCDFDSLIKIFENIHGDILYASKGNGNDPNAPENLCIERQKVEIGQIVEMLGNFFYNYREFCKDKVTKPESRVNHVRGDIKELR